MSNTDLRTPAWQLIGLTQSIPGVLELADDRLAFTTEDGPVFNVRKASVAKVVFPWYYFGGGMKVTIGEQTHRISFVRPNDATDIPGQLAARSGDPAGLLTAGRKVMDIGVGRRAGREWRARLT
jgi:hypothetical protein